MKLDPFTAGYLSCALNSKYPAGQRVRFFAFVTRVGIDRNIRSWITTGKIVAADSGPFKRSFKIRPDDPEYIEAVAASPGNRSKHVFRSEREIVEAIA